MTWRWRWRKKKLAPKIEWQHDAATIRKLLEAKPGNKFLECLLYLRLGYKPDQVADMAKVPVAEVYRNMRNYKKGMPKPPKAKPVKPMPPPFRFPEITGKQGTEFFLKREYAQPKEKRPWQVLFLIYVKTVLSPRDHELALAEIAKEMGLKQADVLMILKGYLDGGLNGNARSEPANTATVDATSVENLGGLPLYLRNVCRVRRDQGHTEEEK